jgi:hypothetical protein
MQNAKDTFYTTLRDRLSALNPARTIMVRGVARPGVLVEENELPAGVAPADAFRLRWTGLRIDAAGPLPLAALTCEIRYATAGSASNGGMDRGRLLAALDAELSSALAAPPQSAAKMGYSSTAAPAALATGIFWADPAFGPAASDGERLERVATVEVFCYREAGER